MYMRLLQIKNHRLSLRASDFRVNTSATAIVSPSVTVSIGYAISPDGIHWGRWSHNPMLEPTPPYDTVGSIAVILEGDTVHAWVHQHVDVSDQSDVYDATSPLDVVFFDAFETGDTSIWSTAVP